MGLVRPRAQPRGYARSGHGHGVCVQHHLRSARLVVARPNETPRPRRHRLGSDAGITSELSLSRALGVRLPLATRWPANGDSDVGAYVRDDGLPLGAVLPARPTSLWAARSRRSFARLQPASAAPGARGHRAHGRACLDLVLHADERGGALSKLRAGPGCPRRRRHGAQQHPGWTAESLVRALRTLLRLVRTDGLGVRIVDNSNPL